MSENQEIKIKRSSDDYIQLNKTITNKFAIKGIHLLSDKWGVSPSDVCIRLIAEGALKEYQKSVNLLLKK